MKKQILFFAVAALALASCSSENDVVQSPDVQQTAADDGAVGFDVYTQRATTRAGEIGTLTTEKLKNGSFKDDGFGVFGYYTNSATYDQQAIPNFFYNQQVTWNGSYFQYEPIKYWPNEYGTTAESEDADKVSFFAYAPYVLVNPSTGKAVNALEPAFDQEKSAELQKWGISSLSRNSATGDPLVKYIASFDQDKCVDLCWGVCDQTTWPRVLDGRAQEINSGKTGLPWLDVERPAEAKTQDKAQQRVKFTFKHATSQLIVKIDAFVDGIDNTNAINNTETRVYVRSINFEGFAMKGALNLNNFEAGQNKAYWLDFAGTNDLVTGESITIYDGRKDGKEGTPSGVATNEKSLGLNPALIQSDTWANHTTDGVTNVEQYLFRKQTASSPEITYASADGPIYVIPTGDDVKVTIVYDIETADKNLATYVSDATQHGSSIENCITKTINFGNTAGMENGKAYTIKLHLGMNSVKFDADVTDWVEADAIPEVDLPANVPQFKSLASGATDKYTVELPATTREYTFAITELNGGEAVTAAPTVSGNFTPGTANGANGSGVAIESVTIAQNMTPNDMAAVDLTWTGASSGRVANMSFIQKAHALELSVKSVSIEDQEIELDAGATGIAWDSDVDTPANADDDAIKVWRNGARLTYESSATKDGEFSWDKSSHKITLGAAPVPGETYNIYVKAGDAEGETVTVHIGGSVLSNTPVNLEYGETFTRLPKFYGSASVTPTYTWSSSKTEVADVDEYGVVTTKKADNAKIKLKTANIAPANGWVYDTSDKTYNVIVSKAEGTISFENPTPTEITGQSRSVNSHVLTNAAVLKNSKGIVLTQGSSAGGTVTYDITSVTENGTDITSSNKFTVTDGELKVGSSVLDTSRTYVITVKATVTPNDNAAYTTTEVSYTITVRT